jgi:hypothetical protein
MRCPKINRNETLNDVQQVEDCVKILEYLSRLRKNTLFGGVCHKRQYVPHGNIKNCLPPVAITRSGT